MKKQGAILLLLFGCTVLAGSIACSSASADSGQPVAVLPEVQYEFNPVPDGTQIQHGFIIQNKGTAVLNIEKVRTG